MILPAQVWQTMPITPVRTVAILMAESGDAAWFSFGGDTYIVENVYGEEYNISPAARTCW